MSATVRAYLFWSGICLLAFLSANILWTRTVQRLRPDGGVEVAPNITLLEAGKLQLERTDTRGWPLEYAMTRTGIADGPGPAADRRFNIVPLAFDALFFAALAFLLASLFGTRRPERFSWQLLAVWFACIAVLAAVGLTPPGYFL